MSTENENPQPATPAPSTPPADKAQNKPADKPNKPFEKRKPRGDGGPKRRVPALDSDMDYKQKTAPNVRDLDAEIADELEAALKDMDATSIYAADDSKRARAQAATFYIHPWEIDPGQPRVKTAGRRGFSSHYVNLGRTEAKLRRLLRDFRFAPMRELLDVA